MNNLTTRLFIWLLIPVCLMVLNSLARAQSVSAPTSVNVSDSTIYNPISSSGTTVSVAGADPIKVVVSATAGTLKITATAGLTAPTGYTTAEWAGAGEIGFSGSLSDVNNALATLEFLGAGTITVSPTSPTVVYSSVTGNFYEVSTVNKNFFDAKADAESRTLNGAAGYLATVTSKAEFDYIKAKAGLSSRIWLGASDSAVEGEWRWVGGPENGQQFWQGGSGGTAVNGMFSDWNGGEPNNCCGGEDYLEIVTSGRFNDRLGTEVIRYVVEYTGTAVSTSASFTVTVSTDPAQKADIVAGLLSKELIAYQFYKGSIESVNDRLAWLASRRGDPRSFKQGINFKFGDPVLNQLLNSEPKRLRDYRETEIASLAYKLGENPNISGDILKAQAVLLGAAELKAKTGGFDHYSKFGDEDNSWNFWSDGEISVGKNSATTISSSRELKRTVIIIGLDKEYEQNKFMGLALSVGRENADVGSDGSTIQSDNIGTIFYTTFSSKYLPSVDASLGYGDLNFETTRIDGGKTLTGERMGSIYFGSAGVRSSNASQEKDTTYSAYARVNLGQINLKNYTERGGVSAVTYSDQDIDYEELVTGVEMSKMMKWNSLAFRARTGLKYSHFLNKSSPAAMRYASSSTVHTLIVQTEMQSGWSLSAGLDLLDEGNLDSHLTLSRTQSDSSNYINSLTFGLSFLF